MQNEQFFLVIFIRYGAVIQEKYEQKPCFRQLQTYAHMSSKGDREMLWVISGRNLYYPVRCDNDIDQLIAGGVLEERKWIINGSIPFQPQLFPGTVDSILSPQFSQELELCRGLKSHRQTYMPAQRWILK